MKTSPILLILFLAGAAILGTHASSIGGISGGGLPSAVQLRDATSGRDLSAVYNENEGTVTLFAFSGVSGQDAVTKVVEVRSRGFFNGKFMTAADVDGDGRDELILPAYDVNQVLVLYVRGTTELQVAVDFLSTGPGPLAVAPAKLMAGAEEALLVASTATSQVEVRGWDINPKKEIIGKAKHSEGFAEFNFLGFQTAGLARGVINPVLGILHQDAGDHGFPMLSLFSATPASAYSPSNNFRSFRSRSGHTFLLSGHPDGETNPGWFLAYAPGATEVEFFPSGNGASFGIDLGYPVQSIYFLPEVDDEVLVVGVQGDIHIYDFAPGTGPSLNQILTPPAGSVFVAASGGNGAVMAVVADASGLPIAFNLFEKDGGGTYQLMNQGVWPSNDINPGQTTVALYTGNPFGNPQPYPFQTFIAGDWATMASYSGSPGQISASVETFGGVSQGLGNPMIQSLQPAANPGSGARALGNQWEPSSSLFHVSLSPLFNGLAGVTIKPAAGAYPNTIAVHFTASPLVTVHYRVNQGPWLVGLGPVWIAQDATVQYYGEHTSGQLSSIQFAAYEIDQPPDKDSDGDFVPDAIEALANTNPFNPDSDGDGENDFSELLGEGDPNDPASQSISKIDGFALKQIIIRWDDTNSAALPVPGQNLPVSDWFNASLGFVPPAPTPSPGEPVNQADLVFWRINFGVDGSSRLKFWLPAGYFVYDGRVPRAAGPAMASLGSMVPSIPIPAIPTFLGGPDPLAAWLLDARAWADAFEVPATEFTFGPASTLASLLFEYWYGQRLVEHGLIANLRDRPHLVDPPRHARSQGADPLEILAIEQLMNQGNDLVRHELSHVPQQTHALVVEHPDWQLFRDVAEDIYGQAIQAALNGIQLTPPMEVLRDLLDDLSPVSHGYVFQHNQSDLQFLRERAVGAIMPQTALQWTGLISFSGNHLAFESMGLTYQLLNDRGDRYRLPGTGLITEGSLASIVAVPWTNSPPPAGFAASLQVLALTIDAIPTSPDTDENGNRIPDAWELAFLGGLGFDFWSDGDGDGFVVGEEYAGATDPNNDQSIPSGRPATPQNLAMILGEGGQGAVQWTGSDTAFYELWHSFDVLNWNPHGGFVRQGPEGFHAVPVDTTLPETYFKLLIDIPLP